MAKLADDLPAPASDVILYAKIFRLMTQQDIVPVIDGHNDVLLRLFRRGGADAAQSFLDGEAIGQLDLPRAKLGGFAGGFFAIFVPPQERGALDALLHGPQLDSALTPQVGLEYAREATLAMAALMFRIEALSEGRVKICRTIDDIRGCIATGVLACILHIEGAEAIDPDLNMLEVLYRAGLRSLGPVWSRPNIFASGVPFRFPSGPDIGPGLTDAGRALIRACNRLKIMVDLSHLNEKGFWDVAELSTAPLVATHSNAHSISAHSRNLTDEQLAAIRASQGMVGVNFAVSFLRPDGKREKNTSLQTILRHLDHLIEHLGEEHVGLGSDFDGAMTPAGLQSASDMPALVSEMRRHGYDDALVRKLCFENWLCVLERSWGVS